jgi:hypothetical protein
VVSTSKQKHNDSITTHLMTPILKLTLSIFERLWILI